ncbi:MAG: hypothetical protein IJ365_02835 [Clostridia bacterium]|nr:hypothetical protein [Clostridia bacterium]
MNKTVVISPYQKDISGTLEHNIINDKLVIRLRLNHPEYNQQDIFRLYAMSTSHAARSPYLAEIFDVSDTEFHAEIDKNIAEGSGYNINDIDTYVVTKFNEREEIPIAGAFMGLEWSAARFLKKQDRHSTQNQSEPRPDTPVENAKQILKSRKKPGSVSKQQIDMFAQKFADSIKDFEKLEISKGDGYEWYKVTSRDVPCALSAVRHVLSNQNAVTAMRSAGHYIAGIAKSDFHHIAIGIPACPHVCPMPQLTDCCDYADGYHIAGIFLANDGQYFEKYLQNS